MPKKMAMAQKYWKTMSSLCCPKKINFPPSAPRNGLARLFPGRYLTTGCKIQNLHRTNIPLLMLEIGNNGLREIFEKSNPSGRWERGGEGNFSLRDGIQLRADRRLHYSLDRSTVRKGGNEDFIFNHFYYDISMA